MPMCDEQQVRASTVGKGELHKRGAGPSLKEGTPGEERVV